MEKSSLFYVSLAVICLGMSNGHAKSYTVGDSSGWDISSDLDLWTADKNFQVGDVLLFQYSNMHSVSQVSKDNFDTCGTTDMIKTYKNDGNTTVELARPGDMYFVCGNKLHCFGGMKLQVHVDGSQAYSPAGGPQASSDLPNKPASGATSLARGWGGSYVAEIIMLATSAFLLIHF